MCSKEYYQKNREKILANNKKWREQNHEKVRAKQREHYRKNRDKRMAYMKEYQKRRNPLAGELINSKKQCKSHLQKLINNHPEGLTNQRIMELIMPFEGRLALRRQRIIQYLRLLDGVEFVDGKYYPTSNDVHSPSITIKEGQGVGVGL